MTTMGPLPPAAAATARLLLLQLTLLMLGHASCRTHGPARMSQLQSYMRNTVIRVNYA
jgi:hypothetical protein